jgi:malate dehydrogenase (oxaloacetate-decarboxylating)(NADP+)
VKRSDGSTWRPAQGNNAYVFPGIGLGAIAADATRITDGMFLTAAHTLAAVVSPAELDEGSLYPRLDRIRYVSRAVANAVAEEAFEVGVAGCDRPEDLTERLDELAYDPSY